MGGDSYDGKDATTYDQPGLADTRWENGYKNDGKSYYISEIRLFWLVYFDLFV